MSPSRIAPFLFFLLFVSRLSSQEVGGGAAAFLRGEASPQRVALADAGVVTDDASMTLFGGSAILSRLRNPTAAAGGGTTPFKFGVAYAGFGMPVGEQIGLGLTVMSHSTGLMRAFDENEVERGSFEARDLAVSLRGGIGVGPGSIGATVRYLDGTTTDVTAAGYSGYTLDISGALAVGNGRFSLDLENIAGEIAGRGDGRRITVPWRTALAGAWLFPIEEAADEKRDPATGLRQSSIVKRSYLALAATASIDADDTGPTLGAGVEYAPLVDLPLQFRGGLTTVGDYALGLSIKLSHEIGIDQGVGAAFTVRGDHTLGGLSYHLMLSVEF